MPGAASSGTNHLLLPPASEISHNVGQKWAAVGLAVLYPISPKRIKYTELAQVFYYFTYCLLAILLILAGAERALSSTGLSA